MCSFSFQAHFKMTSGSGGNDNEQSAVAPVAADTCGGHTSSMPSVAEVGPMETETGGADNNKDQEAPTAAAASAAADQQVPPPDDNGAPVAAMAPQEKNAEGANEKEGSTTKSTDETPPPLPQKEETKKVMSYTAARRAGIIKCKCNRPICPNCTACTRCTCECPGNARARRKGKKKSSGGRGGSGGGDAPANRPPPKKKLRVAEIAAIETHDEILRRLRRTDRTVLVPVAADGTDAYTTSCITDVLARFGASVTVAKVPECSFNDMKLSPSATTTTSMAHGSSPSRSGGSSPTRRSAAAAATAASTESAHDEVKDLICKTSGGGSARVVADMTIQAASAMDWDMIVLPGGVMGCKHLRSSETLMSMLKRHRTSLKQYGAIGEAPAIVLASAKPHLLALIDEGRGATCLPDPVLRSMLPTPATGGVVVQGNLVTAAGPGVALNFALALGQQLYGPNRAKEIAKELLVGGQNSKSEDTSTPLQEVTKKSNDRKMSTSGKEGQGQDDDDSASKYKDCVLSAEDTFMEIVWPTLDTLGWSLENKPTGDGTVYCPPGVKRDAKGFAVLNGDECDDVYCLETKSQVVNFIRQRPISHSPAQHPVLLFTQCMERADDLVKMGRITPEEISLDSVLSEVKQNGNIAEVPLFDEFIWPQLFTLGWTIEEETRHRPKSYVAPHLSFKGADRFKQDFFAPTRKEVIDFLYEDDMWGSKDEVLKVLDVFQACVSVGNEMAATGLLIEKRTPLWLYLKARERRPALPWLSSHLGPEKEEENKKEEKSAEKKENDEQVCEEGEDSKAKLNEKGGAPEAGQLAPTQTDEAGVEKSDMMEVVEPNQEKDASEHLGV